MRSRSWVIFASMLVSFAAGSCSSGVAPPPLVSDLTATVLPADDTILLGSATSFVYRVQNSSSRAITICSPGDSLLLSVGPFSAKRTTLHRPCRERSRLAPGQHVEWSESLTIEGRCDREAIDANPFLANYSLCPGPQRVAGSVGLFVGVGCPGFKDCTHIALPIQDSTASVK